MNKQQLKNKYIKLSKAIYTLEKDLNLVQDQKVAETIIKALDKLYDEYDLTIQEIDSYIAYY